MATELLTAYDETKSYPAWERDPRCVVTRKTLIKRIKKDGWEPEAALSTPAATVGSRGGRKGTLHLAYGEWKTEHAWSLDERCMVTRTGLRQRIRKNQPMEEALANAPLRNPDRSPKTANGITGTLVELVAAHPGVTYQTVIARRAGGMDLERALTATTADLRRDYARLYHAFDTDKTGQEWLDDPRCTLTSLCTLLDRIHNQGMDVEEAITRPRAALIDLGDGSPPKTWEDWLADQRCVLTSRGTLRSRVCDSGMTLAEALVRPRFSMSSASEERLAAFAESLGLGAVTDEHTLIAPRHLDIYFPSHRLAIEYNGVYWHSERYRGAAYHHEKWQACRDIGVQLLQVWEDDYAARPEVVHSMIRHKLGLNSKRVMARATAAGMETPAIAKEFLEAHHIQGHVPATVNVGLRRKDTGDLVAVCLFTRGQRGRWELTRYATSTSVAGGFTKCLAFFTRNCEWAEVRTFADLCVSDGELYRKAGFTEDGFIPPDYRYVVANKRLHKFNFRLAAFRNNPALRYEEGMTERQLALLNNLPRIWDAGKVRWVLTNPG